MHIVDTTLFFAPHSGGVKRYLLAKNHFLARQRGVRHTLVVPGPRDRRGDSIVELRSPAIPFGGGYRFPLELASWQRALCSLEPDVIEAGDPYHVSWAALDAAGRLGVPAVAFAHSDVTRLLGSRLGGAVRGATNAYLRGLYRQFDLVLAPSNTIVHRLRNLGLERVKLQPLGVDAALFHPSKRDPGLRAELGLPRETRLAVFAGRMAGEKRIDVLRRAFEELGRPYHLLLVGGEERRRASANATLWPYEHDGERLARLIASSDVLVHAGEYETFGLVFLEAMACGVPVVGVRSGAVPELIDDSAGVLAEPGSVASLKEAVRTLYEHDYERMGAAARLRVEQNYTWDATLRTLLARYARLARREPLEQLEPANATGAP